jgi:type IV secretion system protein VirB10
VNDNEINPGLEPMPGEAGIPSVNSPRRSKLSWKAVVTVGLVVLMLIGLATLAVRRMTRPNPAKEEAKALAAAAKPVAATTKTADFEVPRAASAAASALPSVPASAVVVPAIDPDEEADPIPVRGSRRGPGSTHPVKGKTIDPTDAPLMVTSDSRGFAQASKATQSEEAEAADPHRTGGDDSLAQTRAGLRDYRSQLQGMMQGLQGMTNAVKGHPAGASGLASAPPMVPLTDANAAGAGPSGATQVSAAMLGDRSLKLPKGTTFTCALKTQVIASASGPVSCQVMRNVYSDDGRVLLIERGAHVDGEYKMQSVRPGMVSIPAVWTRLRMPNGVVVDLDSPATGPLGAAGIDGVVDNRWPERIGAALMVSLIGDSIQIAIADQQDGATATTTSGTYAQTTSTTGALANEVLKSTINLPPIIYKNQGGVVGVYVNKDVDFSSVYALRTVDEHR